jgi:hypothetical protein
MGRIIIRNAVSSLKVSIRHTDTIALQIIEFAIKGYLKILGILVKLINRIDTYAFPDLK